MSDVEGLVEAGVRKRVEAMRALDANYRDLQRGKLLSILQRNADTEFGRARGFSAIESVEAFRNAVRPTSPQDYHEAWERIAAGERNILFADPVYAFALSSGTTGAPKLVPLNRALVRGLKRAIGYTVSSHMARTGNFSLLRGYALQVTAASEVRRTAQDVPVGYVTGVMGAARSYPFHNIGIPPVEVLDLPDWGEKYRIIEERYADHDVRMLFGVPGYIVGLLRRIAATRGVADLKDLWPGLELVVISGAALATYGERLRSLCPGAALMEMYLATEAAMGFQPDAAEPGMAPMAEDVFLEFVPEEDWDGRDGPRVGLGEVEPGVRYLVLVTTPSGLYAYSPGDVVRFLGTDPPRFVVEGRAGNVLNLSVEKVDAPMAAEALRRAGLRYEAFLVCPAAGEDLGHEWVIEFEGDPPADAPARVDEALRGVNNLYDLVRSGDAQFALPVVTPVGPGTFETALRNRPGQGKILRIYKDRRVRDELVALDAK